MWHVNKARRIDAARGYTLKELNAAANLRWVKDSTCTVLKINTSAHTRGTVGQLQCVFPARFSHSILKNMDAYLRIGRDHQLRKHQSNIVVYPASRQSPGLPRKQAHTCARIVAFHALYL